MTTKTTLRAEILGRRRARRTAPAESNTAPSSNTDHTLVPVRHRAEAAAIATQVRALASSMGTVTLPALFVPTALEPDLSLTLNLFPRALLPVLVNEAGAALGGPRWGRWEEGQALATPGRPPAQPTGSVLGPGALSNADLILVPALAAGLDGARLGQGGGWYDRTLPHRRSTAPVVAVVFDDEVLPPGAIPLEPHDAHIDAIITPTRTIHMQRLSPA